MMMMCHKNSKKQENFVKMHKNKHKDETVVETEESELRVMLLCFHDSDNVHGVCSSVAVYTYFVSGSHSLTPV